MISTTACHCESSPVKKIVILYVRRYDATLLHVTLLITRINFDISVWFRVYNSPGVTGLINLFINFSSVSVHFTMFRNTIKIIDFK